LPVTRTSTLGGCCHCALVVPAPPAGRASYVPESDASLSSRLRSSLLGLGQAAAPP
jgi:hypothetical protein